ncbi:MAG: hypothetical protein ABIL06_13320 [Pseudomonadota bacterium]
MAYGRSYGGDVYGMVPNAINSVSGTLSGLMADRMAQKNEEGRLALEMKKLEMAERLGLAKNTTDAAAQQMELSQLQNQLAFRNRQEDTQNAQFQQTHGLAEETQAMNKRRIDSSIKTAIAQQRLIGVQTDAAKNQMELEKKLDQEVTFGGLMKEMPFLQDAPHLAMLSSIGEKGLGVKLTRRQWKELAPDMVKVAPRMVAEMTFFSDYGKLKNLRSQLEASIKTGDQKAVGGIQAQMDDLASKMDAYSFMFSDKDTIDDKIIAALATEAEKLAADSFGEKDAGTILQTMVKNLVDAKKLVNSGGSRKDILDGERKGIRDLLLKQGQPTKILIPDKLDFETLKAFVENNRIDPEKAAAKFKELGGDVNKTIQFFRGAAPSSNRGVPKKQDKVSTTKQKEPVPSVLRSRFPNLSETLRGEMPTDGSAILRELLKVKPKGTPGLVPSGGFGG